LRVLKDRIDELRKSWLQLKKILGLTILSPKLSSERQAFPALHEPSPTELDSKLKKE
jgi:hypothetical protein